MDRSRALFNAPSTSDGAEQLRLSRPGGAKRRSPSQSQRPRIRGHMHHLFTPRRPGEGHPPRESKSFSRHVPPSWIHAAAARRSVSRPTTSNGRHSVLDERGNRHRGRPSQRGESLSDERTARRSATTSRPRLRQAYTSASSRNLGTAAASAASNVAINGTGVLTIRRFAAAGAAHKAVSQLHATAARNGTVSINSRATSTMLNSPSRSFRFGAAPAAPRA